MKYILVLSLLAAWLEGTAAEEVLALTSATFETHLKEKKHVLVEFYAPWCGHCKKLTPEYEQAAKQLLSTGVSLTKVDATQDKELASKYGVKGYPSLIWFEDGKQYEYTGGRTAATIVDWVSSMIGAPVLETTEPSAPQAGKPRMVLEAVTLLPGFEEAARGNRRKATWYFQKAQTGEKITLQHLDEQPVEFTGNAADQESVTKFLEDNALPLYGNLNGDTFDTYIETGKGLVWSLFEPTQDEAVLSKQRKMMTEIAKKVRGKFFVTYTDVVQFKDAIDSMLGVSKFPAIAVQKKGGDKRKFVYDGSMSASEIQKFINDVEAGNVEAKLKSEEVPKPSDDPVKVVVGSTMKKDVFTADKDVLLEVYAPWCGHCKKLEPEYWKLAKKLQKEELNDLISVAKLDGTLNDSPVDSVDWRSFPTIFFVKAGSETPLVYEGERTAKGLWKYIRKHATKAQEIKDRLERRKAQREEL
eukprot:TRINITY_DN2793_c1_g1_i2.p1 TRINITY_DN2793_c1_g1~~TRINITY_DN2793_c1_g1_i2.p1  ORF type:complete len:471 (-),score=120.39 TRINITY_DN2793_c1_g1_i2:116-1528(-)